MAERTATGPPKRAKKVARHRLERGTLTRAAIVDAALRIMGDRGELTYSLLGRELGASPTAMYRHFAGRDDILDAVGDELNRISLDGYEPSESWEDSLRDLADRAWVTYSRHPAAAAATYFRVTNSPNELRAVNAILEALHTAGLSDESAVLHYHMYATMVLALSADHAAKLAAAEGGDESGWEQVYRPVNPEDFPHYWNVRELLRSRDDYGVFRRQVEILLDAIRRAA